MDKYRYDYISDVSTAMCDLLGEYKQKKYSTFYVDVKRREENIIENVKIYMICEPDKKESAINEIQERVKDGNIREAMFPSDNYIYVATIDNPDTLHSYVTFTDEKIPNVSSENKSENKNYINAKVLDERYSIINEFFDSWYSLKRNLINSKCYKRDDIFQWAYLFGNQQRKSKDTAPVKRKRRNSTSE